MLQKGIRISLFRLLEHTQNFSHSFHWQNKNFLIRCMYLQATCTFELNLLPLKDVFSFIRNQSEVIACPHGLGSAKSFLIKKCC